MFGKACMLFILQYNVVYSGKPSLLSRTKTSSILYLARKKIKCHIKNMHFFGIYIYIYNESSYPSIARLMFSSCLYKFTGLLVLILWEEDITNENTVHAEVYFVLKINDDAVTGTRVIIYFQYIKMHFNNNILHKTWKNATN